MKTFHFLCGTVAILSMLPISSSVSYAAKPAGQSTLARSWVKLTATTDQKRYTPGQPIQVRLGATNTFKRGAYLRFTSGQRFDLSVYPAGQSTSAYTWSTSRMFAQAMGSLWLKPGQSRSFDATIGDEMGHFKPGKYRLVAHLANSPRRIAAAPVDFEVTDLALLEDISENCVPKTHKLVSNAVCIVFSSVSLLLAKSSRSSRNCKRLVGRRARG